VIRTVVEWGFEVTFVIGWLTSDFCTAHQSTPWTMKTVGVCI